MDGLTTLYIYTKTSMEQLCKQIDLFEILYFLLLPTKPRSYKLSSRMFPFLSLHFSTFLFHNLFFSSCALLNWYSIVLAFFSASSCFFCASSTASTDDLLTLSCNLEFWSRTSFISSSSFSCSLLLIKPFLFLRSSLLC